eukprot:6784829-Prorocentrum_lima.AAC.1
MTSSLVGSEMCIRDSHYDIFPGLRVLGRREVEAVQLNGVNIPPKPSDAVSYTHLTLPTICSV